LAILGPGYFVVRDPEEDIFYVTRRGDFHLDSDGRVISACGLRLQGFTNPALTEIGDMRIDSCVGPSNANLV
jgi:flagellar hook protein FlgE